VTVAEGYQSEILQREETFDRNGRRHPSLLQGSQKEEVECLIFLRNGCVENVPDRAMSFIFAFHIHALWA